jgi:hypothetical protein
MLSVYKSGVPNTGPGYTESVFFYPCLSSVEFADDYGRLGCQNLVATNVLNYGLSAISPTPGGSPEYAYLPDYSVTDFDDEGRKTTFTSVSSCLTD